jgi:hypothetical protein
MQSANLNSVRHGVTKTKNEKERPGRTEKRENKKESSAEEKFMPSGRS